MGALGLREGTRARMQELSYLERGSEQGFKIL
jgi:hypothetical protein